MNLTKIISGFNFKKFSKASRTDLGVLKVAYMVAALDGEISDAEYQALDALAKKCRGYTKESAEAAIVEALRSAGYLMLLGRRAKVPDLVKAFVAEAQMALPMGFACMSVEDVRRAFVTWVALAMSDGDYSVREKKCIEALRKHFAELKIMQITANNARCLAMTPAYRQVCVAGMWGTTTELVSRDLMARIEELVIEYDDSTASEKALKELTVAQ